MRIGLVPNTDRTTGGAYQYSETLMRAVVRTVRDDDPLGDADAASCPHEIVMFVPADAELSPELAALDLEVHPLRAADVLGSGSPAKAWYAVRRMLPGPVVAAVRQLLVGKRAIATGDDASLPHIDADPLWRAFFTYHRIDLLIFANDDTLAPMSGTPFMCAIHDIQHRLQPEFPEVSAGGEWERREARVGSCVRGAVRLLADSEVGREDLVSEFGVDPAKVSIIPFVPAPYLGDRPTDDVVRAILDRHDVAGRYLFYPAAYWPHKNHARIVEALALLRASGQEISAVFTGSNRGTKIIADRFAEVSKLARTLGVADLIHYLGYVDDADMAALYAGATALIMPTFFGPTNIPVVEAWGLGCPVITSDIRGIREQTGEAALLADPRSSESIAAAIDRLLTDDVLAQQLVAAGYARSGGYSADEFSILVARAVRSALESAAESAAEPARV